jgi:hypothetical protein
MTTNAAIEEDEDEGANDEAACGNSNSSRPAIIGVVFILWVARVGRTRIEMRGNLSCFPPAATLKKCLVKGQNERYLRPLEAQ